MSQGRGGMLDYRGTLDCVHCGLCLPVCPTYQESGSERSSPRGRIYLMRAVAEGRLELREIADEMHFCLGCRACESACPAGVRYGQLVEGARAEIDARGARPRRARMLERLLLRRIVGSRPMLRAAVGALRAYQRSGVQRWVRRGDVLRLWPRLRAAEATIPLLDDPHRPPILVPAQGRRRGRVALFSGCVMPELFPAANEATVAVLARNGFEVRVPLRQACCGALHLHSGDPAAAEKLRQRNRRVFHPDSIDAIVVNSAGCAASLKEGGDALAPKVRDWSEFLWDAGLRDPEHALPLRVAYDDPCHLLHGQGVGAAPRRILGAIPGLELFDLPGSRDCCGAAGIYSVTHPEMAARLASRKVEAVRETQPDVVTTGNPGCMLQLEASLRQARLKAAVLHPVELLAAGYGLASRANALVRDATGSAAEARVP